MAPQVLKQRVLRRLKRDFDCCWAYEEVQRTCLFSALRSHLVVAIDDITFLTFHVNRAVEGRGWLASLIKNCVSHKQVCCIVHKCCIYTHIIYVAFIW